jgi:peptide/nickel transport system substrate-binding protein
MKCRTFLVALGALSAWAGAAEAQGPKTQLTVGVVQETSSLYPNWFVSTPNQQIASHIFETLVQMDPDNKPQPALAESWKTVDDKTWEFKLRRGVTFHDGSPFTADNVIASFDHAKTIEGNGSSGGAYMRDKIYSKVDDFTVRISAGKPYPLLPSELTVVYVYKAPASPDAFNSGAAAIGTGPFKFVEWVRGDRIVLDRSDGYWGEKPEWTRVIFKPIVSDPTRVAALLNGDVDVIDRVPTADVKRLEGTAKLKVVSRPGERIIYLQVDTSRDLSPYVFDNTGKPLWPNPLRDVRVRRALSRAINRDAIVSRVMDGQALAAGQIATPGMFGHNPDIKPDGFDAEGAKALLAQAGHPNGFAVTLHGPNDRYINDARIVETIAQMWTRIGVKTKVETLPSATYFSRRDSGGERKTPEFSALLGGFGTATGETMSQHWMLVRTTEKEKALGHANYARYSNVRIDSYLDEAIVTLDDAKREGMLKEIGNQYMTDVALIPLHWQVNVWAMRADLDMPPRLMEVTHAMRIKSTK